MKPSTQNILTAIQEDFLQENVKSLLKTLADKSMPSQYGETDASEAVGKFERISKFIRNKKGQEIIDGLSSQKRNEIQSNISSIRTHIGNFVSQVNHGHIQHFINSLEIVYDILYPYFEIPEKAQYHEEISEVQKLKAEYRRLLVDLEKLLSHKDTAKDFSEKIKKIQVDLDNLSTRESHIRDMESEIDTKRSGIVAFSNEIDDYKNNIENGEKTISALNTDYQSKITALENEDKDIRTRAKALLTLVNEWALGQYFKKKSDEIDGWWLLKAGVSLSIIGWVWAVLLSFHYLTITGAPEWALVILRFTIFAPFGILAWIFYKEYSFYKRLKEEYDFKSILSLSLRSFSDIIVDHKDNGTKEFIQSSISEIFKAPFVNEQMATEKMNEKIIDRVIESTAQLWEKASQKIIDKIN